MTDLQTIQSRMTFFPQCLQELVKEMSVTQETLNIQTKDKQTLEQRVSDLREENQGLDSEITRS